MNSNYLVYALIVVGTFTGYMAIVSFFRHDRLKDRVDAATRNSRTYIKEKEEEPSPLALLCAGVLSLIGVDVKSEKSVALSLAQAGIRSPDAVAYFLFCKRIVQPVLFVAGTFWFFHTILFTVDMRSTAKAESILLSLIMMTAGLLGTTLYVTNRKQHRQKILLYSFPEALDLLLVCIESGLGLDAALGRVCNELKRSHPEMAKELERTRMELTVMADRTQALQNLADRTEIMPFKSLVAALIQTEKFGTSLLETLRVLSEDQRTTRLLNAEARAARIPVFVTVPLILCIMPAFIIIILGPPIVRGIEQGTFASSPLTIK